MIEIGGQQDPDAAVTAQALLSAACARRYRKRSPAALRYVHDPGDGYIALAAALWGRSGIPPRWHRDAACLHHDPDEFDKKPTPGVLELCRACPVGTMCLADQLAWEEVNVQATNRKDLATTRAGTTGSERARQHHDRTRR